MLGPPGHPGLHLGLAQVGGDVLDDFLEEHVAPRRPLGNQPGDLVVPLGVEGGEGQVLQLPLDRVHAEPVGQRREDLQDLAGLALLLLPRQVAQGAHVVQPVGQLDHQDPDVPGHGDHHLAHGLRLGRLAVLDLVQLGDPVDQGGDLVPEVGAQFIQGVGGVLDRVVQQGTADGLVRHAQLGQDGGDGERVGDVRVAALALLPGVPACRDVISVLDEPDVGLGMGGPDGLDHRLEHRVHAAAAGGAKPSQPPPDRRPATGGRGTPAAGPAVAAVPAGRGTLAAVPPFRRPGPCPFWATAWGGTARGSGTVRGAGPPGQPSPRGQPRPPGQRHPPLLPLVSSLIRGARGGAGACRAGRYHVTGHRHSSSPPRQQSIGG